MEFLCPVVGTSFGWAHLAHLGLIGVVALAGAPLTVLGVVAFRRSAPAAMSRDCDAGLGRVAAVQVPATHRGRSARRSG
jgi:hypothetical protein